MKKLREKKKQPLVLSTLLLCSLLCITPVLARQSTAVDKVGPDYTGNIVMSENLNKSINSNEDFEASQAVGIPDAEDKSQREGSRETARCGTMALKNHKELSLDQMPLAMNALSKDKKVYQLGETKELYSDRLTEGKLYTAEVVAIGETCTIWRDKANPDQLSTEEAQRIATTIDEEIHDPLEEVFGEWSKVDVDHDGKTAFMFYPTDAGVAGFFESLDLLEKDKVGSTGNTIDMLHINSNLELINSNPKVMMGTLIHELQHLINFAQAGTNSEIWLNEAFSESAIAIAGRADRENVYSVKSLTQWTQRSGVTYPFIFKEDYVPDFSDVAYGQWYLFGRYLSHQTEGLEGGGDAIYKTILKQEGGSCTIKGMEEALKSIGYMGEGKDAKDMDDFITNYNLALLLRESSGPYSLSSNKNPSNVDGVVVDPIAPLDKAVKGIPGGGAASFSRIEGSVMPTEQGPDIRTVGIKTEIMEGVITSAEGERLWVGDELILSTRDQDADIFYSMDGSDPLNGKKYESPIVVTEEFTLKACTVRASDEQCSTIKTWKYEVQGKEVTANLASGKVDPGTKVTLSCDMKNADIIYTTDGSEPSRDNGIPYKEPITIEETKTIRAVGMFINNHKVLQSQTRSFVYEVGEAKGDHYEPNNSITAATALSFPTHFDATLHTLDDVDVYTFTLKGQGNLSLTLTSPQGTRYGFTLCDDKGIPLKKGKGEVDQSIRYTAKSGKYIVKVEHLEETVSQNKPYSLSLQKELDQSAVNSLDLSEMNMLTAMTDEDNDYAWSSGVNDGGHFLTSMAYFTNWGGPILEAEDPYDDKAENFQYKPVKASYHVQNALYMPNDKSQDFVENVKNAVYSYGAADVFVMSAQAYWTNDKTNLYVDKYNYDYECYRDDISLDSGHIVAIVGFDDNYSKDNFVGNPEKAKQFAPNLIEGDVVMPRPKNDGAFIIKNSWGTENAGEEGYAYVSYEDAFIGLNNPAVFMADELPDNYNHQYINDPLGSNNFLDLPNAFVVSEHFKNEKQEAELLKAVSFVTGGSNMQYEISVTIDGKTQKITQGVKKYAGFYTERLDKAITIPAGTEFAINVRVENQIEGENAGIGVSQNNLDVSGDTPMEGKAFISYEGNTEDMGAQGFYPNIRAYTCDVNSSTYSVEPLKKEDKNRLTPKLSESIQTAIDTQNVNFMGEESAGINGAIGVEIPSANGAVAPDSDLPEKFDLRETNTLTPIRDQGDLGSCWTFAAMASVENNIARNGDNTVDYPRSLSLSDSEKKVLLSKDMPEQSISLVATLMGTSNPKSTRINWSVAGDVDSVRLENTASFSGESTPIMTALKPGIVTLNASSDADLSITASCTVTITAQGVESMVINPDKMTLKKGQTGQLNAELKPEEAMDKTVLWQSDHPEIANVDENGKVTALSGGKAKITAKAGTAEATAEITVKGTNAINPGANANPKTGRINDPFVAMVICIGLLGIAVLGMKSWMLKQKKS